MALMFAGGIHSSSKVQIGKKESPYANTYSTNFPQCFYNYLLIKTKNPFKSKVGLVEAIAFRPILVGDFAPILKSNGSCGWIHPVSSKHDKVVHVSACRMKASS